MRVRKVGTSGTKGVGDGIGLLLTRVDVDELRRHWMQCVNAEGDGSPGLRRIIVDDVMCISCFRAKADVILFASSIGYLELRESSKD